MSALGRRLEDLLIDPAELRPMLCECSRLDPRRWVKPKGEPGRYVCGVCFASLRRSEPDEFRPGHDPKEILP